MRPERVREKRRAHLSHLECAAERSPARTRLAVDLTIIGDAELALDVDRRAWRARVRRAARCAAPRVEDPTIGTVGGFGRAHVAAMATQPVMHRRPNLRLATYDDVERGPTATLRRGGPAPAPSG